MENRLLNNLVDNMVLQELKGYVSIKAKDIVKMFEKLCDSSEDLEEILDIVTNSKRYNYITLQNGCSYIFGATKEDVEDFIYCVCVLDELEISAYDPVWNEFIYYGKESCRLRDILDKE